MTRPDWASAAFHRWHKEHCDHADPASCGYEGQLWFQNNGGWARKSTSGKTITFYENGVYYIPGDPNDRT